VSQAPDAAALARFRHDLEAVLGGAVPPVPLALAISGGPDSMAMLALAAAADPARVIVATVDHRLRAEAAAEAAMVAAHCRALGVPHRILSPDRPIAGASLQAQARTVRYALLARWAGEAGAGVLLTAHHADDQAETLLMRATRGSGVAGLAGIRARRRLAPELELARPLLGWRRAELRQVAEATGTPFVDDPTNRDPSHDRTRFRALLAAEPWLNPAAMALSARYLEEAEAALAETAAWWWRERATVEGERVRLEAAGLPRELQRRLVGRAIGTVRAAAGIQAPPWTQGGNVEGLLEALNRGGGATRAGVVARASGGAWRFSPAPPRRSG
jgi:tRNA(Ile)-lysidine synthase